MFDPHFLDLLGALGHADLHAVFEEVEVAHDEGRAVALSEGEHELVAHRVH